MAEFEIIWTENANKSLFHMLDFYYLQNGNDIYGNRLFEDIVEKINLLKKQPFMSKETNYFNVRVLMINRNSVFYLPIKSGILV